MTDRKGQRDEYDYIIVGAGAGGAVLAARLAEAGSDVLLLEAGGDPLAATEDETNDSERPLADDVTVPAFHAYASEHPAIKWDFWVKHYDDRARRARDWKYCAEKDGVLYPRCSALGGCTSHHAMITVRPNNADWNHIAATMKDPSWRASEMNRLWRRIERCRHRPFPYRWLAHLFGCNPTGHGWDGWLTTEKVVLLRALRDWRLRGAIRSAVVGAFAWLPDAANRWRWLVKGQADPNDERLIDQHAFGLRMPPMSTRKHRRAGPRERLLDVKQRHPDQLTIRMHVFVTRVVVENGSSKRATGIVYRSGKALYRASPRAANGLGEATPEIHVRARKEVILACGAFNTPQLLMLSGIGDPKVLADRKIGLVHALPAVGKSLQDRYEVAVVSRMKRPWAVMRGARLEVGDRHHRRWRILRRWLSTLYASNGGMIAATLRSKTDRERPDLFCLGLLADFRGYHRGYAQRLREHDYLSWIVLKAYTQNKAGEVGLRSCDPLDPPDIRFRHFEEGDDQTGDDLEAVLRGVRFVRHMTDGMADLVEEEELPGRHLFSDDDLKTYIRDTAWGHHACGSCAMKPAADAGVVDSRFKVYGIEGLRIVDASVFPRIPGYFIASSVYVIAEKAADLLLSSASSVTPSR